MVKKYFFFTCLLCISANAQVNGVGINTENPQQALHLASSTGTVRVEGLNSPNNTRNGGGVDKTFPLFVDANGDFTLSVSPFQNSDGSDAWTSSTPLINTAITVPTVATSPNNGLRSAVILPYTITVTRPVVLEIKYNVSFEVLASTVGPVKVKNIKARRISNFYTLDQDLSVTPAARRYGQASKCYYNNNTTVVGDPAINAAQGNMYNCSTTYVSLSTGTHTIRFYGEVSTGNTNDPTVVNFAVGNDSIFMRLY